MRDGDGIAPPIWRRLAFAPVLLGAGAGLALCALAYFALSLSAPRQPDVTLTARAVCADLMAQRYDDLYSRLDPGLRAQGTAAQFTASQRELDQLQGAVTACAATSPSVSSGTANLTFTLTRSGSPQPSNAQASLTSDGSTWRITAYSGTF